MSPKVAATATMSGAAMGMARREHGEQVGETRQKPLVGRESQRFLAGMGRGGDPDRPRADLEGEVVEPGRIGRRRVDVIFEIADRVHARRPELEQARGVVLALGEAKVDLAEQGGDEVGKAPPAARTSAATAGR